LSTHVAPLVRVIYLTFPRMTRPSLSQCVRLEVKLAMSYQVNSGLPARLRNPSNSAHQLGPSLKKTRCRYAPAKAFALLPQFLCPFISTLPISLSPLSSPSPIRTCEGVCPLPTLLVPATSARACHLYSRFHLCSRLPPLLAAATYAHGCHLCSCLPPRPISSTRRLVGSFFRGKANMPF
jgi:hypothetical protein